VAGRRIHNPRTIPDLGSGLVAFLPCWINGITDYAPKNRPLCRERVSAVKPNVRGLFYKQRAFGIPVEAGFFAVNTVRLQPKHPYGPVERSLSVRFSPSPAAFSGNAGASAWDVSSGGTHLPRRGKAMATRGTTQPPNKQPR